MGKVSDIGHLQAENKRLLAQLDNLHADQVELLKKENKHLRALIFELTEKTPGE